MRAINHALTGALVGLTISDPIVAVPAAWLSHYVLDVLPHHGSKEPVNSWLRSKVFQNLLLADALLCFCLVVLLALRQPRHWVLAAVCAFAAAAPDFLSLNFYKKVKSHQHWQSGWYNKFAGGIQWFERPIGAVVEVAWLIAMVVLVAPFLR